MRGDTAVMRGEIELMGAPHQGKPWNGLHSQAIDLVHVAGTSACGQGSSWKCQN